MKKRIHGSKYESVRKLGQLGTYSDTVTIPKTIIEDLHWRKGQRVVVQQEGDAIVIRDWKKQTDAE
jgi:antitoxin component of MazEF toxin-antitoxin module